MRGGLGQKRSESSLQRLTKIFPFNSEFMLPVFIQQGSSGY